MARTKSTSRKAGKGPRIAAVAVTVPKKGSVPPKGRGAHGRKGKPMSLLQQKSKRLKQSASILREIRKSQKAIGFAIPKDRFQRLVK